MSKSKKLRSQNCSEEQTELLAFCRGVELQSISLEEWQKSHNLLNLVISLFINASELKSEKFEKEVCFSKTIEKENGEKLRESSCVTVSLTAGIKNNDCLVFEKAGDRRGDACGDLVIKICIID